MSVTPIPHDGEHLKKKKKRTPSKLEQDIGVYEADEEYLYGRLRTNKYFVVLFCHFFDPNIRHRRLKDDARVVTRMHPSTA